MSIHILFQDKNLCGRSRTFGGSVSISDWKKSDCKECLGRHGQMQSKLGNRPLTSPGGSSSVPSTSVPYDPTIDLLSPLNPLSPLSPFSPLHHSDPAPSRDHSPSYDPPSHDPSPSHDSGGYDSGSSDSGGGGGGGDF